MTSSCSQRALLGGLAAALVAAGPAQATAPVNDDLADATVLSTGSDIKASYTTMSAGREPGELNHHDFVAGHTVWLRWTPKATGGVFVRSCGPQSADHSRLEAYKGPANATHAQLQQVVPETAWKYPTCEYGSLKFMATAGTTYYFVLDHADGTASGSGQLEIDQETAKPTSSFVSPPALTGPNAAFKYTSAAKEPYWHCRIDSNPDLACGKGGQMTTAKLTDGEHTFSVRATDWYGNVESSWKTVKFTVDAAGGDTTITSPPPDPFAASAHFTFTGSEPGMTFQCTKDGSKPFPCVSPHAFGTVWDGPHELTVASIDKWGNVDPTPAKAQWTATDPPLPVVPPRPQPKVKQPAPATTPPTTTTSTTSTTRVQPPDVCPVTVPQVAPRRALLTTGWRVRVGACRTAITVRLGRRTLTTTRTRANQTLRLRAGRSTRAAVRSARSGARLTVVVRSTDVRGAVHRSVRRATLG